MDHRADIYLLTNQSLILDALSKMNTLLPVEDREALQKAAQKTIELSAKLLTEASAEALRRGVQKK